MSDHNDTPDIPPHIAARKAVALNAQTADLIGEKRYMDDSGTVRGDEVAARRASAASLAAARKAEQYAGPYPLMGLTPTEIDAARGKLYADKDQPKMLPELGDRTPAFVNWLWAKYPWDAAKRFGGTRCIWPTALPAVWPPAKPAEGLTLAKLVAAKALMDGDRTGELRTYTQAEVDEMMAGKFFQPLPVTKPKRIRNRSKKPAPQPVTT